MALTGRPALTAAAVFAVLAAVASRADADGLLARVDRAAYEKVRASRREPAVAAARRVSALAEPTVIYPVVAAVGLLARGDTPWWRASTACLVVAAGAATRRQLSRLIARPRPPAQAWLIAPEGYSLPSKHTTAAVLAAGVSVHSLGVTVPKKNAAGSTMGVPAAFSSPVWFMPSMKDVVANAVTAHAAGSAILTGAVVAADRS